MFINKGDYLQVYGIDLDIELPDDDNEKGKVDRFLNEVEEYVFLNLRKYGFKKENVNDNNIGVIKRALLYQAEHFLKLGRDSGFSPLAWEQLHVVGITRIIRG